MGTTIVYAALLLIAIIAGRLWVTTWQTDNRPIRPEEPRELTTIEKYRIIEALCEDARKEDENELHSGI